MSANKRSVQYRTVIGQRLRAVAEILLGEHAPVTDDPGAVGWETALLSRLADAVRVAPGDGRVWLLFTAVAGAFPTPVQHEALRRRLELAEPGEAARIVLDATREAASKNGDWLRPMRIVDSAIVADVNFCARFVHNTGIQRVVRSVMPHLVAALGERIELTAWNSRSGITRTLSAIERQRVIDWPAASEGRSPEGRVDGSGVDELLVPWHCRVFLPEVPEKDICERLAGIAEFSGNRVSMLGYDTIPIGSADLVPTAESERFARYLSLVKHADEVVAISDSVGDEFRGFTSALVAQGETGPLVHSIPLAAEVPDADPMRAESSSVPLVISVGSHEPRKNQDAVLFAVETLLREGLVFRFVFVGGGSRDRTAPFDRRLARLRTALGADVASVRGMRDRELFDLYREARFSVFASLHEGYGLPVVESIASGTPVLTANYGSLGEIAAAGGCLTVDPRSDDAIVAAMRSLLTDDALVGRLADEARAVPPRGWRSYADDLLAASRIEVIG